MSLNYGKDNTAEIEFIVKKHKITKSVLEQAHIWLDSFKVVAISVQYYLLKIVVYRFSRIEPNLFPVCIQVIKRPE